MCIQACVTFCNVCVFEHVQNHMCVAVCAPLSVLLHMHDMIMCMQE